MFEFRPSKKFKEDLEPHEILLDRLAKKKEEEIGISEKKLETLILEKILRGFLIFSFLLFFLLFLRVIQLQAFEKGNLSFLAQQNKYILGQIQAQRGVIYDRNMEQLVSNDLEFNLVCEKENLPKDEKLREDLLNKLSVFLKIEKEKIKENLESGIFEFQIKDIQTFIILETKIDELAGCKITNKNIRKYVDPSLSHILGYTGKIKAEELKKEPDFYTIEDFVGREGLEKSYEKILRKIPGKIRMERDAKGNIVSKEIISLPQPGKSLVLYLDFDLQKKIKEELENKIKEVKGKGGAAIAIDPNTGGILAMVSWPSFDNNLFSKGISQSEWGNLEKDSLKPLLNRATSGQYLLGSTIKPFIASAALQEKIISPQKKIDCQGQIQIGHKYNPEIVYTFKDWIVHGLTDIRKAIAESCNVFFYTIGGGYGDQEGLGPSKIKKYLELFGLGEIPEIDLPVPEWARGNLPDPEWKKKTLGENWWDGDTYNLSIGQGYILATPLQVASAFSAIANGGKLLKPKLVWKIVDSEKNLVEESKPEILRENFIDQKNLQIVREGMRWAVTGQNSPHASAVLLSSLPVAVAAKTGTAQVSRKDCPDCYNIWIAVFAPYENPQIVLVIVLEDVKGLPSYQVVVPLARDILDWYFSQSKK
jgi:penicillin-binding protein 2